MTKKHAILVETLTGIVPRLMAQGGRVTGALTSSRPYQRLVKALEGRAEARAMKQLQESARGAVAGPYPGSARLPGGQIVSAKSLEEAGVPLARQMGKAEALKTLGL